MERFNIARESPGAFVNLHNHLSIRDRIVLSRISEAAKLGGYCPTNADLADALGVATPKPAIASVAALERGGYIAVERTRRSRVVTIIATGDTTARGGRLRAPYDALADLVAEGETLSTAAKRLGITEQRASQLWKRVCADTDLLNHRPEGRILGR